MKLLSGALFVSIGSSLAFGQLTVDQKLADFQAMAGQFAKRYAPYDWKRDVLHFDLLDIAPWIEKIRATRDDLAFYDVMSEYVASLNDAHDAYRLPANFAAKLNFTVDVFDGKLLVDTIDQTRLSTAEFPFLIGYELVSIDGQDADRIVDGLLRYGVAANPRSTRRVAASMVTARSQNFIPTAAAVPEISTVVFRRPDGKLETYRIPWTKSGLPLTSVGRFTTPAGMAPVMSARAAINIDVDPPADYMEPLLRLQNCRIHDRGLVGFGALAPVFAASLPSSFVQRLGKSALDPFYSGVFEASGLKIGFIRIPTYSPANTTTAVQAFRNEITFFQANTDGLVVDEMRNPGGSASYMNQLLALVMPNRWRSMGFEVRATGEWVVAFSSALESAKAGGAPDSIVLLLDNLKTQIVAANREYRGRTGAVPLDTPELERDPLVDNQGKAVAYTKPLIVLIDELSASGGDAFAATVQDNGRGPLVGWRTMGAGGSVEPWEAGTYSGGTTTLTESLMNRKQALPSGEFPVSPYVENVGVRPDIEIDYMTRDNLMQNGQPFVNAFVDAITDHILKSR